MDMMSKRDNCEEGKYALSLPKLYPGICHLDNELHPKQSHQHGRVHLEMKLIQRWMTK